MSIAPAAQRKLIALRGLLLVRLRLRLRLRFDFDFEFEFDFDFDFNSVAMIIWRCLLIASTIITSDCAERGGRLDNCLMSGARAATGRQND